MKILEIVLAATLIMGLVTGAVAQQSGVAGPPLTRLEDYAARNDIGKPAGMQFVSLRCASLYLFSSGMLKSDSPEMAAKFEEASKVFVTAALGVAKDQAEFVADQLPRMVTMYGERARAAKAATGNVFEDPILRSDIQFCKRIAG